MSTAPTVTLHGFWRSSATWRVRIALAHKGIAYQYIPVNLRKGIGEQNGPEFAHLNPMRQVPVLEIDDLEGVRDDGFVDDSVRKHGATLRLTQSLAILEYLEERFPAHPLLPPDRNRRARARMIAEVVNSGTQPFQNTSVQQYLDDIIHSDSAA
ncbi:MAG TPA: glutathione S-transferase N-terminal domain-containing protein, partial [Myxococcota bacterium]